MFEKRAIGSVVTGLIMILGLIGGGCSIGSSSGDSTKAASIVSVPEADSEIRAAMQLIERVPDSPSGYVQLAITQIQRARHTGDFGLNTKAETAINRALEIAPNDVPSRKVKASLLLTFHRFAEGLEYGTQLNAVAPNDSFVYGVLTDANFELGNYEAAIANAQKMVDLKPNSSSYARVAHLRSIHGDHKGSINMYRTAAQITDPKDKEGQSWCLVQLGDEYYKYGNFADADKSYDEALSVLPDYYLAVAAKGKVKAAQNDLDAAEKYLTLILNRIPNVESAILLGDVYSIKGDSAKATEQYDLAELMEQKIGVNTDQKRLAMMWADQNRKLPEALEIATREFGYRKDIYTADALAWAQYKTGQFKAAKESITQAMRTKANDARISFHAGMIEEALGNREAARKLIDLALKQNPAFDLIQSETARQTLSRLNRDTIRDRHVGV